MGHSADEIRHLSHAYKELGNAHALTEHYVGLNDLTTLEKQSVDSSIVWQCHKIDLQALNHAINKTRRTDDGETSFHVVLLQAYKIKRCIKCAN